MPATLLTIIPFWIVLGADVKLSLPLVSAKVGATVSIKCTVTGETFLGWFNPSGSKITTSQSARVRVESSGNGHELKFVGVKVSDGSEKYECRGQSNKETLIVHVPGEYDWSIYTRSVLTIECMHCHAIKNKIKNYAMDKVKKLWYCR